MRRRAIYREPPGRRRARGQPRRSGGGAPIVRAAPCAVGVVPRGRAPATARSGTTDGDARRAVSGEPRRRSGRSMDRAGLPGDAAAAAAASLAFGVPRRGGARRARGVRAGAPPGRDGRDGRRAFGSSTTPRRRTCTPPLAAIDGVERRRADRRRPRQGRRPVAARDAGGARLRAVVAIGEAAPASSSACSRAACRSRGARRIEEAVAPGVRARAVPAGSCCSRPRARAGISSPTTASAASASRPPLGLWTRWGRRWPGRDRSAAALGDRGSSSAARCGSSAPRARGRGDGMRRTLARRSLLLLLVSDGVLLTVLGLVMILSAGSVSAVEGYGTSFWYFNRQLIYAVAGRRGARVRRVAPASHRLAEARGAAAPARRRR